MLKKIQTPLARSLTTAFCTAAALSLLSGNSLAADTSADAKGFLAFDANQDGFVDVKEAHANPVLEQSFNAADLDKDGRLSMEEFNKGFATK